MDLSDRMTEIPFPDLDAKVVQAARSEARRNRSCRGGKDTGSGPRSQSRHRHPGGRSCERSCERDFCSGEDGKENFLVPCTPKTPRTKTRPITLGASPPPSTSNRAPRSPPSCLTTTLPATSEINLFLYTVALCMELHLGHVEQVLRVLKYYVH
jgi:hypothetical protein